MRSLTLLSFDCIVKSPFPCRIPTVSAAQWLTPTQAFLAWRWTCWVGVWIVLAPTMTDFGNLQASHYIFDFQRWSIIEWWILNAHYSTSAKCKLVRNPYAALWNTPVAISSTLSSSRCFQPPLELCDVSSDSARAFSRSPENTCSDGGVFQMLWDLTIRIVKLSSCWDFRCSWDRCTSSLGNLMPYSHTSGS